jgi:hypothetical protein
MGKKVKAWAIKDQHVLIVSRLFDTRREAYSFIIGNPIRHDLYRSCKIVRVEIREVAKKKGKRG